MNSIGLWSIVVLLSLRAIAMHSMAIYLIDQAVVTNPAAQAPPFPVVPATPAIINPSSDPQPLTRRPHKNDQDAVDRIMSRKQGDIVPGRITASAGSIFCTFQLKARTEVSIACSDKQNSMTQSVEPGLNLASATGRYVASPCPECIFVKRVADSSANSADVVEWSISQPITGIVNYVITANGKQHAGRF